MRLSARIGIVVAIVGVTALAAIPFRQSTVPAKISALHSDLPIERRIANRVLGSWTGQFQSAPIKAKPLEALSVGIGEESYASNDAPELPAKYHRSLSPVGALLNPSDEPLEDEPELLDSGAPARALTHKIADGDTLSTLALQYLGDASLANKLFEANREVLPSLDLLPIGRLLRIPTREEALTPPPADVEPMPALAPIPRGAFGR